MNKKVAILTILLLTLNLSLAYAPDFPSSQKPYSNRQLSYAKQDAISATLQSVGLLSVAPFTKITDVAQYQGKVTIPSGLFTVDQAAINLCKPGSYSLNTEFYRGEPNQYGFHNSDDYAAGPSMNPDPLPEMDPTSTWKKTVDALPTTFIFHEAFLFWTPPLLSSKTTWSVSQYIGCVGKTGGYYDVTAPYKGKTPTGKQITGSKIYLFPAKLAPNPTQPPPPPPACKNGDVRCNPKGTNVAEQCVSNEWASAINCEKTQATCDNTLKLLNPQVTAAMGPLALCRPLPCVPDWEFVPSQDCNKELASKPQPGSYVDIKNCNVLVGKPSQNPFCPDVPVCIIGKDPDCPLPPPPPSCTPGVDCPGPRLGPVKIEKVRVATPTGSITNIKEVDKSKFTVYDELFVKFELANPSTEEQDAVIEIGIYPKEYIDSQAFFQKAQLFSLFVTTDTGLDSCGKQTKLCQNDDMCEATVQQVRVSNIPPTKTGETIIVPRTGDAHVGEYGLKLTTPKFGMTLAEGNQTAFNPESNYYIAAYLVDACGGGWSYNPWKKPITISCTNSVDEWKTISPERFKYAETSDNPALITAKEQELYVGNRKFIEDNYGLFCVNSTLNEQCLNETSGGGLLVRWENYNICVDTETQQAVFDAVKESQKAISGIDLKKLVNTPNADLSSYACAKQENCPASSTCYTIKYLEEQGILSGAETGLITDKSKALLTGAGGVAGCLGALFFGSPTAILGTGAGLVTKVTSARTAVRTSVLGSLGVGPGTACLLGGAVGAGAGYATNLVWNGVENFLTSATRDPKSEFGYCVTTGTETTTKPGVIKVISDALGVDEKSLIITLLAVAGLYVASWFFKK